MSKPRNIPKNKVCPYCRQIMNSTPNDLLSATREHLVPNTLLKNKRDRGDYDFWTCKGCNSRKSDLDFVLATIAKMQAPDEDFAVQSVHKALDRNDHKRYLEMIATAKKMSDGRVALKIPVSYEEIAKYCEYLAKGAYYLKRKLPLSTSQNILLFEVFNNSVMMPLERSYKLQFGTSPVRDLESNKFSIVLVPGEALIWHKNNQFLFVLHDRFVISIKIARKNSTNQSRLEALRELYEK